MDDLRIKDQIKNDGWVNLFSGLGTVADKSKSTRAVPNGFLMDLELETIYADDGLGARIIDLLPDDMMKQGCYYARMRKGLPFDKDLPRGRKNCNGRASGMVYENPPGRLEEIRRKYAGGVTEEIMSELEQKLKNGF